MRSSKCRTSLRRRRRRRIAPIVDGVKASAARAALTPPPIDAWKVL
jgi:hypothetical protein